ncbi:protein POLYCHOME isoform X2 [Prosopis cineraria]|uniref:protein POLYCHOME isoform X2 n=1 Tax=Prosopis cineraria TaxID=364024 RepID=UPI00241086E3|nr:protein POLYCHOME isoform X2 [Prosopis cineraria]
MPESRDRLSRPLDIAAIFARRRANISGILDDELESALFGPIVRRQTSTSTNNGSGRGRFGSPRTIGRGRARGLNLYRSSATGLENTPPGTTRRGRGRRSRSLLPSWHPRTPLRDITAVTRRRRERLGDNEGQQTESPNPSDQLLSDPSIIVSSPQLELGTSVNSSSAVVGVKLQTPSAGKAPMILLDITTSKSEGESELLTPQKQLLNSIDKVEEVVREELQKFRRTPTAKKAEREKRVRTLMSMR